MNRTDKQTTYTLKSRGPEMSAVSERELDNYLYYLESEGWVDSDGFPQTKMDEELNLIEPPTIEEWLEENYTKQERIEQRRYELGTQEIHTEEEPIELMEASQE